MNIGNANFFNGNLTNYEKKPGANENLAIRIVNNRMNDQVEQDKLGQRQDIREKTLLLNIHDGPMKKLSEASLIDRGLTVVRGIYEAFQKSVASSREQYIDPMLDEMSEYEKQLEEVSADPNASESDIGLIQSEIDFLREKIQSTTDRFMKQYSDFYGGFLKGIENMYNKATDGQFGRTLAGSLVTPDGEQGLMELSAKELGLDNLDGSSSEIKERFDEATAKLTKFREALEEAQNDFREANGLKDNAYSDALKLMMHSEQLDLLDHLLVKANAGAITDTDDLNRIQEVRDVNVEFRVRHFDQTV